MNIARIPALLLELPALFDCRMFPEGTVWIRDRVGESGKTSSLQATWPLLSRLKSKEPKILRLKFSDAKVGLLWRL